VSIRTLIAILLGLALGLTISAFTYFNDAVIRQTMFVGNFLPISVFGMVIVTLLAINPLLRLAGPRLTLTAGQLAIITAIGLTACAWPGSNLFRSFITITALPPHLAKSRAAWQANEVMSYVPGGSPRLGLGHVSDWSDLTRRIAAAGDAPDDPLHAVWQRLSSDMQRRMRDAAAMARPDRSLHPTLLGGLNEVIEQTAGRAGPLHADPLLADLDWNAQARAWREEQAGWRERAAVVPSPALDIKTFKLESLAQARAQHRVVEIDQALNRAALAALLPGVVQPMPRGEGMLLGGGRADPYATEMLVTGWDIADVKLGVGDLPWRQWWPTIRLWGGLALLLGLAALCLSMIVHPQWSRRELLAYPIARFIDELAERDEKAWLPRVASNRLFWYAMACVLVLHGVNGLSAWFPEVPKINLTLQFQPLNVLFPNAQRVNQAWSAFTPPIYLSAMAFAFFLATSVSFSIGIALYAWMALGSLLLINGVILDNDFEAGGKGQLLRFGGYVATAIMILYVGRRYYVNVAAGMIGLQRDTETPAYAVWAARCMVILLAGAVVLGVQAGLDPWLSAAFILLCMLTFLVLSRIVAETGVFFVQAWWMPMAIITALFGTEAIGPTTFIALALCSIMLVGDPRETLMPYLINGLQMGDRTAHTGPARLAGPMALMIVLSFVVALVVTFYFSYNRGVNHADTWSTQSLPAMPFNRLAAITSDLAATGTLAEATESSGLARLTRISPQAGAHWWVGLGMALVFGAALARLRLSWWPIHPVLFLVWGTYPNGRFYFSFLLGWLLKTAVVKTMGAKGYHALKPLMVGIIAGELLAGLFWMGVGAVYYAVTNQVPKSYFIFPG
jgi:hypothetical protein